MTTTNAIKALRALGATISNEPCALRATLNKHRITLSHNADSTHVHAIHVARVSDVADSREDYFPGSYYPSFKKALAYVTAHTIQCACGSRMLDPMNGNTMHGFARCLRSQ